MFMLDDKVRVVGYDHDTEDGPNPNGHEGTIAKVVINPFTRKVVFYQVHLPDCVCHDFGNWIMREDELEMVNAS